MQSHWGALGLWVRSEGHRPGCGERGRRSEVRGTSRTGGGGRHLLDTWVLSQLRALERGPWPGLCVERRGKDTWVLPRQLPLHTHKQARPHS